MYPSNAEVWFIKNIVVINNESIINNIQFGDNYSNKATMPSVSVKSPRQRSSNKDGGTRALCSPKDTTPTFCLSGSQVSLTPRPGSLSGKASVRCVSVTRRRRPMSAVTLSTQSQNMKKFGSKPRPKSADITKIRVQGHSMDDESFGQTWEAIEDLSAALSLPATDQCISSSPQTGWTSPDFSTHTNTPEGHKTFSSGRASLSDPSGKFEKETDDLLDQLLEGAVENTKKQLRFAQTESSLFKLDIPTELISGDLTNPTADFLENLVSDVKHRVKSSFDMDDQASVTSVQEKNDFEEKKLLVEKLFTSEDDKLQNQNSKKRLTYSKKPRSKPRSIAELLQIIDGEIPMQMPLKPGTELMTPVRKKVSLRKEKSVENVLVSEILTPSNIIKAEYQDAPERANACLNEDSVDEKFNFSELTDLEHSMKENDTSDMKIIQQEPSNLTTKNNSNSLTDILDFLDQMERNDEASRIEVQDKKRLPASVVDHPILEVKGNKESVEVKTLKQALQERSAHVELLKDALRHARVESATALAECNKEHRASQRKLKSDNESALKKLQDGMDKLLADKQQLVEKVEALLQQIRSVDGKHQAQVQTLQQRHAVELTRAKQLAAAAEKVRRERWVERQTARIKELTVKGLEPELTRLNLQHENKVAQIQAAHARELKHQIEAEARHLDELRFALTRDKDEEIARERALLSERFDRQLVEEREAHERRCQRLTEDAASEIARLKASWATQREASEAETRVEIQRIHASHEQHIAQIEEKKEVELAAAREELRDEQRTWLAGQARAQAEALAAKQQELREERDSEIERAIERLEAEERSSRAELEKELDKKIQRLCEQHAAVLSDRELAERLLRARLDDAQTAMQDSEEQLLNARAAESRLRQELCISVQRVEALEADQSRVRENTEKQFTARVAQLETALQQQQQERRTEMEKVHAKLKAVLEKKDQRIEELRNHVSEANMRCKHLESLLGRQPLN